MAVTVKWIGDKLVFNVAYKDVNNAPIVLDAVSAMPGGQAFLGTSSDAIPMTLANGKVTIVSGSAGTARFELDKVDYTSVNFDKVGAKTNYNRLQAWITGTDTEHITYTVTEVPVLDPRTADLTAVPASNTIVSILGPQGPKGDPGDTGTSFVFDQPTAVTTWIIAHNLHRFPSVTLVDTAGDTMGAAINYANDDVIVVSFSAPTAGRAYCN